LILISGSNGSKKYFQKVKNRLRRNFAAEGESVKRVHLSDLFHWSISCGPFFSIFFSLITQWILGVERRRPVLLTASNLPRSPLGWVRSCWRHRQVGHFAKIVSHLLRCSTPSLGRRRRRVSFQPREKQLNVPGFIFGSLNLISNRSRWGSAGEREREKNHRERSAKEEWNE